MASSFASRIKKKSDSLQSLGKELQKLDNKSFGADERYWKLEVDKAGNGMAIIRFLDSPDNEEFPFVRIHDHGFKGPGGWYIENSRHTLGEPDFAKEYVSDLWNKINDMVKDAPKTVDAKKMAGQLKMRTSYHANILVVEDPANPENNGRVMLYKFGKSIMDIISSAVTPEFADEVAVNPFDMMEGGNFRIKARLGDNNFRTYASSSFDTPSQIAKEVDDIETIWNQAYSLQDLIAPENFKTYAELKTQFMRAMKLSDTARSVSANALHVVEPALEKAADAPVQESAESDDADMEFFRNLADKT